MAKAAAVEVDAHGQAVRVTSPDRVIYPATERGPEVTKLEVVRYYVSVGNGIMRALGDRPVTLQRFPEGIEGEEFFSKNPPKGAPAFVEARSVTYNSGRRHPQLILTEIATAVWAVQMNTIVSA